MSSGRKRALVLELEQCAADCGNYGDGAPDSSGPAKQCLRAEQMLLEAAKRIQWCEDLIEERSLLPGRKEVLEEAAKVCEELSGSYTMAADMSGGDEAKRIWQGKARVSLDCAAAIRALAEQSTAGRENKAGAVSSGAGFKATDSLLGPVPSRRLPNNPALPPPPERRKGERRVYVWQPGEWLRRQIPNERKSDRRSALTRTVQCPECDIRFDADWQEKDLALKGLER